MISTGYVAYVLGMNPKKLNRWYKHSFSGYNEAKDNNELRKNDYTPKRSTKSIRVPIVVAQHLGKHVAIDEKRIKGNFYTILSNGETGKIILMARSLKSKELYSIVKEHLSIGQRYQVEVITKDGAQNYDWLSRQAFPQACRVLDKFHVLRWAFEALQQVRLSCKNNYLIDRQNEQIKLDIQLNIARKHAKKNGGKVYAKDYKLKTEILGNTESVQEVLQRSRYLLFKHVEQWKKHEIERAEALFKKFPQIEIAYTQIILFRDWYSREHIGNCITKQGYKLQDWISNTIATKITQMKALAFTVKRWAGQITNFFIEGKSNAPAEALNRNLKRIIYVNYGIREMDYFFYRLNIYNQ